MTMTVANDASAGVPTKKMAYPHGEPGIRMSIEEMCEKIREGSIQAVMRSFAGNVLKLYGFPRNVPDQAAALLDFVRKNVGYVADPVNTEMIQTAAITLCVEGAPVCIPIGDCDDMTVALATLLASLGIEVEIVRQFFGDEHQQHVLLEVRCEDGSWLPLDPSSQTTPPGQKFPAVKETRHSPWEGVAGANYVGVGSVKVIRFDNEAKRWRRVRPTTKLGLGDACCSSCAQGKTCEGEEKPGLGDIFSDLNAKLPSFSLDPYALVKQFWAQVQGRSWSQAVNSANERAKNGGWVSGNLDAKNDFITLLVSTGINAKIVAEKFGDLSLSNDLIRTWQVIADRAGIKDPSQTDLQKMKQNAMTGEAPAIGVPVIIAIVIAEAIVAAAIIAALIYFADSVIDNVLSKIECDRELVRLHAEYNKIVDYHLQNPQAEWTDEEKKVRHELIDEQRFVAGNCVKPKSSPTLWPWAIAASIVGVTVLGVAFAPEIKTFFRAKRLKAAKTRRSTYRGELPGGT